MAWERFFTQLLINKTDDTYLKYNKHMLNPAYVQDNVEERIMREMEKTDFVRKN